MLKTIKETYVCAVSNGVDWNLVVDGGYGECGKRTIHNRKFYTINSVKIQFETCTQC